ncbi:MAG TPA: hypothetical protein PK467_05270 [Candidatus Wallbacteria bacterium]|nr:hypothetical protein [Candidatus Wallbacteria bacterium]
MIGPINSGLVRKLEKSYNSRRRSVSGNAVLMLLPIVLFMLVFGYALIRRTSSEHTQSFHVHRQNVVTYLAEGAINIAMQYVSENLEKKYKKELIEDRVKMVNLYEKIPEIKKNVDFLLKAMPGSELAKLTMDFSDAVKFDKLQRDPNEKMGLLIFTCGMKYYDVSTVLKIVRDIKIVNVSPPAEEFTLYTNTPQANEIEINDGPSLLCTNKDADSGATGNIRIAGGEKGNIFHIGERYAWDDQGMSPMPERARWLTYSRNSPSQAFNALDNLPKPSISLVQSSIEAELKEDHLMTIKDNRKSFHCVISIEVPLTDEKVPPFVYGGVPYKKGGEEPPEVKPEQGYGKGCLFGYATKTNVDKKKVFLPKTLYGKGLKKLYAKYNRKEEVLNIPVSVNPPRTIKVYVYYYGPEIAEKIVEPYSSANRAFSVVDSDSEGRIGFDGCAALKGEDYKRRAFFATEEINMQSMQMFANGGSHLVNGVLFANKIEIGQAKRSFSYNGRFMMVADGEMTINNDIYIDKKLAKTIPSNLTLVLHPKNASEVSQIVNPIKYKAKVSSVQGEKTHTLMLDANIFSYHSMEFVKGENSNAKSSAMTTLFIFGNLSVNRLLRKEFSPKLHLIYKKRLAEKDYGRYVVNMSPIYSAWYEDKKGGK